MKNLAASKAGKLKPLLSLAAICLVLLAGCGKTEADAPVDSQQAAVTSDHVEVAEKQAQEEYGLDDSQIAADVQTDGPDSRMYQYSTTLETEKPELDEVTRQLISEYRQNPTQENYDRLREQVGVNYDKVLSKKKEKLEELKATAKEQSKIDEMQIIVDEMIRDRENRIDQTMLRFTDPRLVPGSSETLGGYVPVMGAGQNIYISVIPVTNEQYASFVEDTGCPAPPYWVGGTYSQGQDDHPVVGVSYADAEAYCAWLSGIDLDAIYRLPSEAEWELAAGHMPKDAEMNSGGTRESITSVYEFSQTTGASGAIDLWGNVWEWTSTERQNGMAVKGGAWDEPKTNCRTEYREESRDPLNGYGNVGFRIIREVLIND